MKKLFLAISLLSIAAVSCKKVSDRKLDGDWKVVSGVINNSSVNSGGTTTTESAFDGATISGTVKYTPATPSVSNQPTTNTIETPTTIDFSFDKKTNKYTKITTQKTFSKSSIPYYIPSTSCANCYVGGYFIERRSEVNSTITEEGVYRITGGTGDVKKNTQILLIPSSVKNQSDYIYTYYDTGTETPASLTDKYKQIISGINTSYQLLSANLNESITSTTVTEKNNQGLIWTVNELKKGTMDISYSTTQNTTVSSSTTGNTTNTETVSYKLSEK